MARAKLLLASALLLAGTGIAVAAAPPPVRPVPQPPSVPPSDKEAAPDGAPIARAPLTPAEVPEALRPWIAWALRGREALTCPSRHGDGGRVCAWPSRLGLAITTTGGTFTQEWEAFAPVEVPLPGGAVRWPLDVKVDGRPAFVRDADGSPRVRVPAGRHAVTGRFAWDALPESLPIPPKTGLVALTVSGRGVASPQRGPDGAIFIGRAEKPDAQADALDISVHRRLVDGVPVQLETRVRLAVAGKSREIVLGKSLPEGFEAHALDSPLPVRVEADGRLRVQARAGDFTLTLVARRNGPVTQVARPDPQGPWKDGEEVWAFAANPEVRLVTVQGAPPIDPTQTTLPDEWRSLPAYALAPGGRLELVERRRGDSDPAPDQLHLRRDLWLDFAGGGFTVRDGITGQMKRGLRLDMAAVGGLGRVAIDGRDQLVTRLPGTDAVGFEIRTSRVKVLAESRFSGGASRVPVAWRHDFQSAEAKLAIPPGWRLLHASGADVISGTWLEDWSLLDVFLLLVTALATGRLFGWRAGAIALVGLGLSLQEAAAPAWAWLAVLVAEAVARGVDAGWLGRLGRLLRLGTWVALAAVLVPFLVHEVRVGWHPALEEGGGRRWVGIVGTAGAPMEMQFNDAEREQEEVQVSKIAPQDEASAPAAATPAAPPTPEQLAVEPLGGLAATKQKAEVLGRRAPETMSRNLAAYDPTAVVQSGPGIPRWSWGQARFTWNGPLVQDESLRLFWLPPWASLLRALVEATLLALLALVLLRRPLRLGRTSLGPRPLVPGLFALALFAGIVGAGHPARAASELPPKEILEELAVRLLEPPACQPSCASLGRMELFATPTELRLRLDASAAAPTAVPLPGSPVWSPTAVRVNGKPATLARDAGGVLWTALAPGAASVELVGPFPSRDSVQIQLPLAPHRTTATLRGWRLDGLHEDGEVDGTLQLVRVADAATPVSRPDSPTEAAALPAFVRVERTLLLGLEWQVATRVVRETAAGTPFVVDVPLVPGESVTTPGVRVDGGRRVVVASFGPEDEEIAWEGALGETPELRLSYDKATAGRLTEQWILDLGPIWHATFTGIPPLHQPDAASRMRTWRPWPGEEVRIGITRPPGAAGQALTIDKSELVVTPGARATKATLTLTVRTSRAGQHTVTLPPGASLESVRIDKAEQPVRAEAGRLVLPVHPGSQTIQIDFREEQSWSTAYRTPAVDLGAASANVEVTVKADEGGGRWILYLSGPRLGPAVHFWSLVVVLALMGWALGRARRAPLGPVAWTLLLVGAATADVSIALVLAGCFLALGWRSRTPPSSRAWAYDLGQLASLAIALLMASLLFQVVKDGLLARPDMGISGNGSHTSHLAFYQDRSGAQLPQALVVSAPLFVYRAVMLAWSLWLASATVAWARWLWGLLKANGLWRPIFTTTSKEVKAASPTEPPASPPAQAPGT